MMIVFVPELKKAEERVMQETPDKIAID